MSVRKKNHVSERAFALRDKVPNSLDGGMFKVTERTSAPRQVSADKDCMTHACAENGSVSDDFYVGFRSLDNRASRNGAQLLWLPIRHHDCIQPQLFRRPADPRDQGHLDMT